MSIATDNFEYIQYNVFGLPTNGDGHKQVDRSFYKLPDNLVKMGYPQDIVQLRTILGPENVQLKISASLQGKAGAHACWQYRTITMKGEYPNGDETNRVTIATSPYDPGQELVLDGNDFTVLVNNARDIITYYSTEGGADGSGSGCGATFNRNDGWTNMVVNIKIECKFNLYQYCTLPNSDNLGTDMCYNFMSDYLSLNGLFF